MFTTKFTWTDFITDINISIDKEKVWKYMVLFICVKNEWNNLEYNFRGLSSLFLGWNYYFILCLCYFLMLCRLWLSRWKTEWWKMDTGSSNQRLDDFSILLLVFCRMGSVYFIIHPSRTFEHLLLQFLCCCFFAPFSSFYNFCLHVPPIHFYFSTTRYCEYSKFNFVEKSTNLEVHTNIVYSTIKYSISLWGATNSISIIVERTKVW